MGRAEERVQIARGMKDDNLPVETIARYTGLSIEEVKSL